MEGPITLQLNLGQLYGGEFKIEIDDASLLEEYEYI